VVNGFNMKVLVLADNLKDLYNLFSQVAVDENKSIQYDVRLFDKDNLNSVRADQIIYSIESDRDLLLISDRILLYSCVPINHRIKKVKRGKNSEQIKPNKDLGYSV